MGGGTTMVWLIDVGGRMAQVRRTGLRHLISLLIAAVALLPAPALAEWREASSEHFVIVSEGSERELIRTSQRLEAVHWLLTQATNRREALEGQRVRVYMLHNMIAVRSAAGVPDNSNVAAIYFSNPSMPVAIAARDRPTNDLFHEYAHHFMRQYMPSRFPRWFVEGFAEVVSTASFELEGRITYGKVADERRFELQDGIWTPTARMFAQPGEDDGESSGPGGHAGVASYGQYWLTAHYLLFAPERRGQLARYIAAITRGDDPDEAASASFPGGLAQLDNDLRSYLRRADFQYRPVPLPEGVMRAPTVRLIRPGEAAALRLEMEAARTWGAERNAELLPRVAALASQHPGEPAVHALHASVLIWTEDYAGAMTAADRGIAIDADHARSNALRAYALFRKAADDGQMEPETMETARSHIERARATDPREPALAMLGRLGSIADAMDGGEGDAETPKRGRLLLTPDQGQRFRAALDPMNSDQAAARAAFESIATDWPNTALARYSRRMVLWIDDGRRGPPPDMTDDAADKDDEQSPED